MAVVQPTGVEAPPLAQHDSSILDLAFGMDTTSSMGSYIRHAQRNIRTIVEEIVANEKSDVRLALVEYRDHPPQDITFVTRTNDFTSSVKTMKGWLDNAHAHGGGDLPEAVADGLQQVLNLSWREEATKICVFISDAAPHGLIENGDSFPNGCPDGLDPVEITNQLAEKGITLYCVGCEPAIASSRDFYMALAHITGGQYVPLCNAALLSQVIIGGAQEEISLQRLMTEVDKDVVDEMEQHGGKIDEEALHRRIFEKLKNRASSRGGGDGMGAHRANSRGVTSDDDLHEMQAMLKDMFPPMDDTYSVDTGTIDEAQSRRMVFKSYMMNKPKFNR